MLLSPIFSESGKTGRLEVIALNSGPLRGQFTPCVPWRTLSPHAAPQYLDACHAYQPGDTPLEGAKRELKEETGYAEGHMVYLGMVHANPAIFNNKCHTYLALDCQPDGVQNLDDKEDIEVVLKQLDEIPGLIKEGVISHSLILAAFYRYYMEYQG